MSVVERLRRLPAEEPAPSPDPDRAHAVQALLWSGPRALYHWVQPVEIRWRIAGPDEPADWAPGGTRHPPTAVLRAAARAAAAAWEAVADVDFVEVRRGPAEVIVGIADFPDWRRDIAYTVIDPDGADRIRGAEVWLDAGLLDRLAPGELGRLALVHEFGHVLGLDHPYTAGVFARALDDRRHTVMSYTPADAAAVDGRPVEPAGPMLYDIAAVQTLYGPATGSTGNDVYRLSAHRPELRAVWDAGGHDRIDAGNQRLPAVIDLREGGWSSLGPASPGADTPARANLVVAFGTAIEDARGGRGDDRIYGNDLDNRLVGGRGDDLLVGAGGDDRLAGGRGDDRLVGGPGADRLKGGRGDDVLAGGPGDDRLVGGKGLDLAVVEGRFADFALTGRGRRLWLEDRDPADGDEGRDRLAGIERVLFDDGVLVLDAGAPRFHPLGDPITEALLAPFDPAGFVG